ncbi:MAG: SH3 domain-containing protein [Rhodobacteraceae bacterium]|nr:SH3 domain-containing protein [Paracoccaceae bacterium]
MFRTRLRLVLAFALCALPATLQAHDLVLPFVDEAAQSPGFATYREELIAAIAARDAEAVADMAAPEVKLSFGGDYGRQDLLDRLHRASTEETNGTARTYWTELEDVLALGGTFDASGGFTAPYFFTAPLPEDADPFAIWFVTQDDTPIYDSPSKSADIIDQLEAGTVLELGYDDYDAPVRWVRRADGREGYVRATHMRSLLDYRAIFEEIDGNWQMTIFVAGD